MDIFHFFRKKPPILLRCTECYYEYDLSPREVRLLEKQNANDTICAVKEPCHICHIGLMIPVNYVDKSGKRYLFHEIKPNIKNLDPNTVMKRIFNNDNDNFIIFINPSV